MAEKPVIFQPEKLYKIREIADITRTRPMWIWKQIKAKRVPAFRPSRHWLVLGADLNAWLLRNRSSKAA